MVKAVVGDEARLNSAENRLSESGITSEVGLVIGKLSSALDRGFIFDLIPTPPNDAGLAASSLTASVKGSKSKSQATDSSLVIDVDWVAEHARQVCRMLVGGVNVVGVYVWLNDSSFKNSTVTLCQTVKAVAEAAPILEADWDERLLLHICYSPRRWTCRNCMLSSNITSSSIRPCDFKMGKVLSSLQTFRCTYNFDLRVPVYQDNTSNGPTLSSTLPKEISLLAKELKGARAIIDGKLIISDEQCTTDSVHEVELLSPFMKNLSAEACSKKVVGVLVFAGSVYSYAYSNSREPMSQAVADIKDDIIRSLQSRLDIICDEADQDISGNDHDSVEVNQDKIPENPVSRSVLQLLRKPCCLQFPRRVFVPWLTGLYICDYLQPSETLEVLKDHCVELMSIEAPTDTSTIIQPEIEAPSLTTISFWDVAASSKSASNSSKSRNSGATRSSESSRRSMKKFDFNAIAAVFFLVLSLLVGFVLVRKS